MEKIFGHIIESKPIALVVLGGILTLAAATGGHEKLGITIPDLPWRILICVCGIAVAAFDLLLAWRSAQAEARLDTSKYDFRITSHAGGDTIEERYTLAGTYKAKPPEGFVAMVVEIDQRHNYRPRGQVIFGEGNTWRLPNIFGGTKKGEEKYLAITLADRAGKALYDYYDLVGTTYNYKKRPAFGNAVSKLFPECHRIRVTVR